MPFKIVKLVLLGPMLKALVHSLIFLFLTILTQLGGLAWLIAICFKRRWMVFFITYAAFSVSALWLAPHFGREPLPCFGGEHLQVRSSLYCALNRQYVVPELKQTLIDFSADMQAEFPDTTTIILDANFPFLAGFPLLPHLSHHDGRKVDIAFYYQDQGRYLPKATKSPIGYFAFEAGPTDCPPNLLSLRWDMKWLQSVWPNYTLEPVRMKYALELLSADKRVGKLFIEPHLKDRFGVQSPKIRFQGCRAARHDDHIHIQL